MNLKGAIQLNDSHEYGVQELFKSILNQFTGNQIKLAMWLIDHIDLSELNPHSIQSESPFEGSDSILAGSGLILKIEPHNLEKVIQALTAEDYLYYEVLHLEIEVHGSVQFAAYDHFEAVLFGPNISLNLLEELKERQVISCYELLDKD